MNEYRTNMCGQIGLSETHSMLPDWLGGKVGDAVTVSGWVNSWRDHGGLVFIDLRDRTGLVQLVIDPSHAPDAHRLAGGLRNEFCIRAVGHVVERAADAINPNLPTGAVEIRVDELEVLSTCDVLPFQLEDENVDETLRVRWRFLDLRRDRMHRNILLRYHAIRAMRDYLDKHGFIEIETPILAKSTPEGARDFLVPARTRPGDFYALPQSPQLFKQLLMVAGFDRYYQVARCFRDEDLRADRQLEFTQLDVEMSFVTCEDIYALFEGLFAHVWSEVAGVEMQTPFPRITYGDAMLYYGSDKPDLRYTHRIADVGDVLAGTQMGIVRSALDGGGVVRMLAGPGGGRLSRKDLDDLVEYAKSWGAKGLAWFIVEEDGSLRSPLAKFLTPAEVDGIISATGADRGDAIFMMADTEEMTCRVLGALRTHLIDVLELTPVCEWAFTWVVDPPLMEYDEEGCRWKATHHPFTAPSPATIDLLESDPGAVMAQAYDLVLNGFELSSGSIRIHSQDTQQRVFRALGIEAEEAEAKFTHLLRALRMGAPPHGGFAPGIDRIVMLLAGESTIREVIAFPRQQNMFDPMTESPSPVDDAQLRELHIKVVGAKVAGPAS